MVATAPTLKEERSLWRAANSSWEADVPFPELRSSRARVQGQAVLRYLLMAILPILISAGVRRRFGLTTALAAPMSLPWNGPVKL